MALKSAPTITDCHRMFVDIVLSSSLVVRRRGIASGRSVARGQMYLEVRLFLLFSTISRQHDESKVSDRSRSGKLGVASLDTAIGANAVLVQNTGRSSSRTVNREQIIALVWYTVSCATVR